MLKLRGLVSHFFAGPARIGSAQQFNLGYLGELGLSQVQAPKALRAAAGVRYAASMGSATLLAPVGTWPTTTATMGLYNDSDNRYFFIDSVGYTLGSGTPPIASALLVCTVSGVQTRPTMSTGANGGYAGTVIGNLGTGQSNSGGSKAVFATALTLLATGDGNPAWHEVCGCPGGVGTATAGLAGHNAVKDLEGGIIVPPRGVLGMAILSGSGTSPLFAFQVTWDEYQAVAS